MVLQRQAPQTVVRVDGEVRDDLHVLSINLSTGGDRLDYAVLDYLPGRDIGLEDDALIDFDRGECEILVQTFGGDQLQLVHWGMIVAQSLALDGNGGRRGFVSRMEHFHFGVPLRGMRCRATPQSGASGDEEDDGPRPPKTVTVREDVVFNGEWEGRCVGNKSKARTIRDTVFVPPDELQLATLGGAVSGAEHHVELDPKTADGLEVEFWTLSTAVQMLCDCCNGDGRFISNPTAADLAAVFGTDDKVLRNHKQPLGKYLPEQLDHLLRPYGYDWCVDYAVDGGKSIRVFARGRGVPGQVKLQSSSEHLDMAKSNAEEIDLTADVASRCVNEFLVLGDYEQVEATFELVPAWPKLTDDAPDEDLLPPDPDTNSSKWLVSGDSNTSRTWRDWALNEAGDYNGERDGIEKAYDLAPIIGPCIPKRRHFEPTITTDTDGTPFGPHGGITVEWWDPEGGTDGTGGWRPLSDISAESRQIKILAHECGIRFDGDLPPSEIRDQGIDSDTGLPKAKVRVTASVRADRRVEATRSGFASPLDPEVNSQTVDVGSRFKKRTVHSSSIYYGKVQDGILTSTEIDDTPAAKDLGDQLLANWCQASISGSLKLTGCGYRPTAALGRPLSGIVGRNIDFRTTADGVATRYPIVVGLAYDFVNQTLGVTLDTFRGETI